MNPKQQRIAIAEACGWQSINSFGENVTGVLNQNPNSIREHIPNYLNDLNAMHEAITKLSYVQLEEMAEHLKEKLAISMGDQFLLINVTAKQHAEAFLKTIGKWEEKQP